MVPWVRVLCPKWSDHKIQLSLLSAKINDRASQFASKVLTENAGAGVSARIPSSDRNSWPFSLLDDQRPNAFEGQFTLKFFGKAIVVFEDCFYKIVRVPETYREKAESRLQPLLLCISLGF